MTNEPQLPQDDLLDVIEMVDKIENFVDTVLQGNDKNLAVSAIISAAINLLIKCSSSITEVKYLRSLLDFTFKDYIRELEKEQKKN